MKQIKIYVLREIRSALFYRENDWSGTFKDFLLSLETNRYFTKRDVELLSFFLINVFECECILTDAMSHKEAIEQLTNIVEEL